MYKAFLFDLNGTVIDDMHYHTQAWHGVLNALGANISYEAVEQEMYGKNEELLIRIFGEDGLTPLKRREISVKKEEKYQEEFRPYLKLIDGLDEFLNQAYIHNIQMAIGTAAIMYNVDFVLDGLNIRKYVSAIVSADDVQNSKPHPETFLKCAALLKTASKDCVVFEDSPKGVEAALQAGMDAVVILTMHNKEAFKQLPNIKFFINDFKDPVLLSLF
ncbi:MAG: HAD family hydrolase [Niabella sp.]